MSDLLKRVWATGVARSDRPASCLMGDRDGARGDACRRRCARLTAAVLAVGTAAASARNATAALYTSLAAWEEAVGVPTTSIDFCEPLPDLDGVEEWYADGWGLHLSAVHPNGNPVPLYIIDWPYWGSTGTDDCVLYAFSIQDWLVTTVWARFDTPIVGIASTFGKDTWVQAYSEDLTPVSAQYAVAEQVVPKWGVTFDAPATWVRFKRWDTGTHMFGDLHWAHVPAPGAFAVLLPMLVPALRGARRRGPA